VAVVHLNLVTILRNSVYQIAELLATGIRDSFELRIQLNDQDIRLLIQDLQPG